MTNENLRKTTLVEFSRPLNIPLLSSEGKSIFLNADSEERQNLAKRFGLIGLEKFEVQIFFPSPLRPNFYPIKAHIKAEVIYQCGVTLEPFKDHLEEDISFEATSEPSAKDSFHEDDIILTEDEETIEPLNPDGFLDLGEIMAQYLSLALDPYPRNPKVKENTFIHQDESDTKNSDTQRPFLKLASLKNKNLDNREDS